jgi:uncharacterized protein (UPF0261 family)
LIHTGIFEPTVKADISNEAVAKAAGYDIREVAGKKDRAYGTDAMTKGVEAILPRLYDEGTFDAVISLGGTGGTTLATAGMQRLPIGVPKLVISTVAGGDVSPYVGSSDVIMYPSIVDVAGLNEITKMAFTNAANAIAGMVKNMRTREASSKPLIAASMFGVTTPCVDKARMVMEGKGYEVITFHATGTGGKAMEGLIASGYFKGVLDISPTEWCDELFGGVLKAGPHRLEAAALNGVPQVVSVGALDMVNFGPRDTVPEHYRQRNLYQHNPTVTLMRTTVEENKKLGEIIAEKLNMAAKATVLLLPLKGVSMIDAEGQPFYGPEEDKMLFDTLRKNITNPHVRIIEMNNHINDPIFAETVAQKLLELLQA